MRLASLPKSFDHSWKNGNHNYDNNDEKKVLFNDRYVSKEKTQRGHSNNPKSTSHNIIEQKPRVSHSANPGNKRGHGRYRNPSASDGAPALASKHSLLRRAQGFDLIQQARCAVSEIPEFAAGCPGEHHFPESCGEFPFPTGCLLFRVRSPVNGPHSS